MITRTAEGYALNHWEGRPIKLPTGEKITAGEVRAAICRKSGLNQRETSQQLHCSVSNVKQYWQSLYYKLRTDDVVLALDKLIDLGAIIRLCLILSITMSLVTGLDNTMARRVRTRRGRDFASLEEAADLCGFFDHEISLVTKWVYSLDEVDA